jgi:putative ABC transport system permease protein
MKLRDIAFDNIRRRKAKMFFLTLGMIIGITTVIALLSITSEMQSDISKKIDEFGANILIVPKSDDLSLAYGGMAVSGVSFNVKEIEEKDLERIMEIKNKDNIKVIAPKILGAVEVEGKEEKALIVGVDFESEFEMKKWWNLNGAMPSNENETIIGSLVSEKLNKKNGDKLLINDEEFLISGVLMETGSQDDSLIFLKLKKAQKILNKTGKLSLVEISALCNNCPIEEMVRQISEKLPNAKVTAVKQVVKQKMDMLEKLNGFSLAIVSVVLIIGSLIVLTTMMSSVNERTREIGIFRAIGFRRTHVMQIILLEAFILSLIAGVIGYLLGSTSAILMGPMISGIEISTEFNLWFLFYAISLSIFVGIFATLYPAFKASQLDPAEALRYF